MPAAGVRPTSKCPGENGENGWELMGSDGVQKSEDQKIAFLIAGLWIPQ